MCGKKTGCIAGVKARHAAGLSFYAVQFKAVNFLTQTPSSRQ